MTYIPNVEYENGMSWMKKKNRRCVPWDVRQLVSAGLQHTHTRMHAGTKTQDTTAVWKPTDAQDIPHEKEKEDKLI